jgi:hypothetical protein
MDDAYLEFCEQYALDPESEFAAAYYGQQEEGDQ